MPLTETDGWKIYIRDTLLGTAYYRDTDQPFMICTFKPTPAFEDYLPIFDEFAAIVNDPNPTMTKDAEIVEFYETKIASLNLILQPFGNAKHGNLDVAQIYDGKEIWLRPL